MLPWRTVRDVMSPAAARIICAACRCRAFTLFAAVVIFCQGCETPKQERVRDYSDEGVFLYQRGNYAGARDYFEVALAEEPRDPNVLYNLGQCHDRLGQVESAEKHYRQCLDVSANHADCRHALAVLLYRSGRRAEADQMNQAWLESEPALAAAYAEDGWRFRQNGEFLLAVGRFQQALQFDPKNLRALAELGQIYERHQRPELALVMYQRALETSPQHPELTQKVSRLKASGVRPPLPD